MRRTIHPHHRYLEFLAVPPLLYLIAFRLSLACLQRMGPLMRRSPSLWTPQRCFSPKVTEQAGDMLHLAS